MSGFNSFYVVTAVIFAVYALLAVLQSRDRYDRSPAWLRVLRRYFTDRAHRLAHLRTRRPIGR